MLLLLLRNKHIPHSTLQQSCSRDKYALKGFDWEESNNHYFCLLQNMLMNLKSLGPWCYNLGLKADYFTSHAPIQRCLKPVHKARCELKSHRIASTCWLQGWFEFAGSESESSIWQLFCFIQALATVLFQHISSAGADEAVRALINGNIDSIYWGPPRQTIARCITQLIPSRQGGGCRDTAGANKAHGLAILPPKWHFSRQLTVPPAEPRHRGLMPRAGFSPSVLFGATSRQVGKAASQGEIGDELCFANPSNPH